ncbi:MAG TPA: aminotransferase class I/II-fold pyridoxal phosphate-dependent enzyme [Candidatus Dormibacteraeota bacterium]|nr:aminotransferase class I/II-fold pyridoxal phosphate-dependent enzyme [Candidatus Dormibacteraeota bacterium]
MTTQYQITGDTARELEGSVEDAIRAGGLRPGEPLPTVRGLASDLGVSPATVAAAYRELRRRGLVAGAGRAGTRVRAAPPIASRPPLSVPPGARDLRTGGPDPALLPPLPPLRATGRLYGEPAVSPALGRVARERLAADGIDTSHLAVVGGALDGVERVLGAHLRPGDTVAVEDPGYGAVLDLVVALGLEVAPLHVDERGAVPEALARALESGARAAVLTPRAQNPTGAAWDGRRAGELAAVLRRHPGALVIEDDHAGPAAGTPALTVCRGLPTWATVRSVSKWLGPDLRVAVLAGDATTVSRVEGRQALGAGWVSHLLQDSVARLWDDPATSALLERAAQTYGRRRRALTAALAAEGLVATGSSGLTAWVPVRDEHSVVEGLVERGWAVTPGERFRIASPPGIRIAFATLAEDEAPELARALADCIRRRPVRDG